MIRWLSGSSVPSASGPLCLLGGVSLPLLEQAVGLREDAGLWLMQPRSPPELLPAELRRLGRPRFPDGWLPDSWLREVRDPSELRAAERKRRGLRAGAGFLSARLEAFGGALAPGGERLQIRRTGDAVFDGGLARGRKSRLRETRAGPAIRVWKATGCGRSCRRRWRQPPSELSSRDDRPDLLPATEGVTLQNTYLSCLFCGV